jgi:hypothetical protein
MTPISFTKVFLLGLLILVLSVKIKESLDQYNARQPKAAFEGAIPDPKDPNQDKIIIPAPKTETGEHNTAPENRTAKLDYGIIQRVEPVFRQHYSQPLYLRDEYGWRYSPPYSYSTNPGVYRYDPVPCIEYIWQVYSQERGMRYTGIIFQDGWKYVESDLNGSHETIFAPDIYRRYWGRIFDGPMEFPLH